MAVLVVHATKEQFLSMYRGNQVAYSLKNGKVKHLLLLDRNVFFKIINSFSEEELLALDGALLTKIEKFEIFKDDD